MRQKENSETSVWISNTDLITGVMVIFLFLAILRTQQVQAQKQKLEELANLSMKARIELRDNLDQAFTDEEKEKYNLNLNVNDIKLGSAYFLDSVNQFAQNSSEIPPSFKAELEVFLPKYIGAIAKCNSEYITEIRIEGHTSSEWGTLTGDEAYYENMRLSQERTRAILQVALALPQLASQHDLIKDKLTANGLSSSKLKYNPDGSENKVASRRIEFRVVPNDADIVSRLNALKQNDWK